MTVTCNFKSKSLLRDVQQTYVVTNVIYINVRTDYGNFVAHGL